MKSIWLTDCLGPHSGVAAFLSGDLGKVAYPSCALPSLSVKWEH